MNLHIEKIKKRNGEIVSFDASKIESAITKSCDALGILDKTFIPTLITDIVADLEHLVTASSDGDVTRIPSVEDAQNIVERNLMKGNHFELAKAYIIYRDKKNQERQKDVEKIQNKFENQTYKVTKADGSKEYFDAEKIKKLFNLAAVGYEDKCTFEELISQFKKNIVENIKTSDINKLLIKTCVDLIDLEKNIDSIAWQEVAARISLFDTYKKAVKNRNITIDEIYTPESYKALFDDYIQRGLYYKDFYKYYTEDEILEAGKHLSKATDLSYTYTTVLSVNKRYLLNPNKVVKELPQEMYMSAALFLAIPEAPENRLKFAIKVYEQCSQQKISLPTPTLMNARTNFHQLSSCFKLNLDDDLRSIFHNIENMAQISKFGGGIGTYVGNVRSEGASIRGYEGVAGGVLPWIKVMNDTAVAVNQLGARKGSISVTLDVWHRDIYNFLDMQTETGDIRSKAFDVFPAISIPNLFMERVQRDDDWTLFDPKEVKDVTGTTLQDKFGEEFSEFYITCEDNSKLKLKKTVKARELFKKFLKTTVETGMPYVFFRDTANELNPNKHAGNVYSTQLCTEIIQNTSPSKFKEEVLADGSVNIKYTPGDNVVCNLASINIAKVNKEKDMKETLPVVMRILDNVVTLNFYPVKETEITAKKYRSVGLGYMGLAEYLATNKYSYDALEARTHVNELFEKYSYYMYKASVDLAKERGAYELFKDSEYDKGILLGRKRDWYLNNTQLGEKWNEIFDDMAKFGVRFAYHTAPAPNTSTAGVVGTTAGLLPIYKKYFVETNLSSPTVRVAPKLSMSNFWLYKEYTNMDMNDVIDMIATVQNWIDQSISFEWMVDPSKVSPKQLYDYYVKAWNAKIKTVYYVRSLSGEVKDSCVSCSG